MSKIRHKATKPENELRSLLHKAGYRFRKNVTKLPGKPDIVLRKYNVIIFVHGCFWHRHDCKKGQSVPTNRQEFWIDKFEKNKKRDNEVTQILRSLQWEVIVVWECQLKNKESLLLQLSDLLTKSNT